MANNPNTKIEMTNREKWSLQAKAKQGWKCYFIERDQIYELQEVRHQLRDQVINLRNNTGDVPDYEYLKKMFLDLYDKVGEVCDCPVCYEPLTKENTDVPLCGHLVCKTCKPQMVECPICKKKY
jgi:hypothetical protein